MNWVRSNYFLPGNSEATLLLRIYVDEDCNLELFETGYYQYGIWLYRDMERVPNDWHVIEWMYIK